LNIRLGGEKHDNMKNKTTTLLLTLVGFLGIAGLQYLYLNKPLKAILWFLTLGMFGIGTVIDVFTISGQVEQYNVNEELKTIRAKALM
jgi:TM2 domain-containing membrane protein YozV